MLKKKNLILVFCFVLCCTFLVGTTPAQSASKPSKTVTDFYSWFLNTEGSFENSRKIMTFVTAKLFNKNKKLHATAEGNFYTFEASGITVSPGTAKILSEKLLTNKATVTVLLKSSKDYSDEPDIVTESKLKVTLIKDKGVWKIDDIEDL